jgi:hypothetical protein
MRWLQGQPRGSRGSSSAAGADDPSSDGKDSQPQAFGFPPASGLVLVEGEGLHPGEQVGGEGENLESDLVVGVAVEGQVAHPGVFQGADAVLGATRTPTPSSPMKVGVARFQMPQLAALPVRVSAVS